MLIAHSPQIFFPRSAVTEYMVTRSKQMTASIAAGQTMELRREPRHFITSTHSSTYPSKSMAFASDDDPPAYINDPLRRDYYSRTRARDGGLSILPIASVYASSPSRMEELNPTVRTTEPPPLRPNRRDDNELGVDSRSPTTQVLLPISANHKLSRHGGSSGGFSGKNWLRNIKSPIGEPHTRSCLTSLAC